ncbi:hypothetical protein LENED_005675 [Lentinula edodes]|uniref:Uncharacterized protein n=1 Tax=Lentinula edodes TaxID=5353 RepID=A0A1Q3E9N1_LENED|nr:hypothetical protein LENED_005675 [Lentinula edodes]
MGRENTTPEDVLMDVMQSAIPGTLDEVLIQAGFPSSETDTDTIASEGYLVSLCIACNIDVNCLKYGKPGLRNCSSSTKNAASSGTSNDLVVEGGEEYPVQAPRLCIKPSVLEIYKSRLVALDNFIRRVRFSTDTQTTQSKGCLDATQTELRNSRAYILKIEDEISENRKIRTQSIIHNQKHSYMINEMRLQVFDVQIRSEIQHREEHLRLLNRIEELESRFSGDQYLRQAKRVEELEIELAKEKLVRGKAASILLNEHDPFVAREEALGLLKPPVGPKLPPALRWQLESTVERFHEARRKLFREQVARNLTS